MKALKIVMLTVVLLLAGIALFLNYIGCFSTVVIEEKKVGPFVLVYEDHIGDYKGTAAVQDGIYNSLLKDHGIETFRGFGIYYDNPREVPVENLRSIAGCILEEGDSGKMDSLKSGGLKIMEVPLQDSLVVEFPFKNSFSIFAGIMKVYPALNKYIEENKLAPNEMMEIYDVPAGKIVYLMKK